MLNDSLVGLTTKSTCICPHAACLLNPRSDVSYFAPERFSLKYHHREQSILHSERFAVRSCSWERYKVRAITSPPVATTRAPNGTWNHMAPAKSPPDPWTKRRCGRLAVNRERAGKTLATPGS